MHETVGEKNSTWWIFHIRLRCTTPLGLPATSQRQNQNIRASYYDGWISMTPWTNIIDWLEWNHPFQPYFHFPFITFSFGCATPFCRNQPFAQSELETTLWKVCSSCRFSFQFHFFSMRISLSSKDGLPTLLSTLGWHIPYAVAFFLIGWYSVCYSLNSSQACLALVLLFFTDFRTDVSPLCRHLDLLFFLIITGLLVSHFP